MQKAKFLLLEKIILFVLLAASLVGYCYFETSIYLRIIAFILSFIALGTAFLKPTDKPQLVSQREILFLLILYLGLYSLYNFLYGLSLPLFGIMLAVLILVCSLFFGILMLDRINEVINRPLFNLLVVLVGLIILEIFLSLTYWPIDPQLKSLIIVSIFYLIINLIYLYAHSVLQFKRIIGFCIVVIIVLAISLMSFFFGFSF